MKKFRCKNERPVVFLGQNHEQYFSRVISRVRLRVQTQNKGDRNHQEFSSLSPNQSEFLLAYISCIFHHIWYGDIISIIIPN